ncbi:hypothetical protein AWC27_13890 [Mycobacterium szulgai]|uniref:Helix-turn-helix domain-containing protein n=1 Tax=Mycobacterium szulgai TaxID=1787 RepID=A0A1X2DKW2_MYCSZ|nr:hypothetical protein AWC27_13890 [Mycobacterium szulgai]
MTQAEAGAMLGGVGRTKVWGLANEGKITRVSVGRRSFIVTQSILDYVDRLTQAAQAAAVEADHAPDTTTTRHKGRAAI